MQHRSLIITVGAVACRDGRYLFIEERIRGRLMITQPSGHLEANETLIDAVIRETREESGYRFEPRRVGGFYFWRHPSRGTPMMRVNFIGEAFAPTQPVCLDEGIERAIWRSRTELLDHTTPVRHQLVLKTIDDYEAGKSYPLELLRLVEDHWLRHEAAVA